nr:cobalamin biosynthesis protein [uncultured bacterium]
MPRTAVIALSTHGAALAWRLASGLGTDAKLFLDRRFAPQSADEQVFEPETFDLPIRPLLRRAWGEFEALILFLPVGAAVRLAAPLLNDKRSDPALVCVDDGGRYAVSVLSGHLGGADRLAERVAAILGAEAVVTSGSHATGTLAVDLLGTEFGWTIEADSATITRASAAVVNREPVGVYQGAGETDWWPKGRELPPNITVHPSLDSLRRSGSTAALIISDESDPYLSEGMTLAEALPATHVVLYRPRALVAGMGCRRGVPAGELEQLLRDTFCVYNLSLSSLACIASATLKQDEPGLLALSEKYSVPFLCYESEELNSLFEGEVNGDASCQAPNPSANARRLVGVWGVAEPASLLASGASRLLVSKQTAERATISVARKEFTARRGPDDAR